jgi:citronellol/citronellal dehydrogenase
VERADVLVVDAAGPFGAAGGGLAGLRAALDGAWDAVREVANVCWVGEGQGTGAGGGGKIVLVAPPADAGEHAAAVGAALENLARTLSVEWARFGVRVVAIRAASANTAGEVAELVAFVASAAGEYYSGSTFSLSG